MGDIAAFFDHRRIGVKAIIYFEVMTTFAMFIGLIVAHVLQPGSGLNINTGAGVETPASIEALIPLIKQGIR